MTARASSAPEASRRAPPGPRPGAPAAGTPRRRPAPPVLRRIALHAAALAALLGVFALYAQPDFLVMLADRAWSCF